MVEAGEACDRKRRVASRQRRECRAEVGVQAEPVSDMAQPDDLGTHRKRRQELRTLQRSGRIREYRETVVHAALPVVPRLGKSRSPRAGEDCARSMPAAGGSGTPAIAAEASETRTRRRRLLR